MPFIILGLFGLYTLELGVVGILPMIVERFQVTVAQAGLLMSLFAFIVALCGPFLVLFFSNYDRKKILVGALLCFSLCSVFSAFAPNYATLMALRVLPAMLHPVFFSAAFAAAISLYPRQRATHATTVAFIGTTLGLVFGVPLTTWLADSFSYEVSILFCAVATLLAGAGLLFKLPAQVRPATTGFGQQLAILRKAAVLLAIAATVLVFTAKFAVYSYAAHYLMTQTGMDGQTISLMLVIFGIGGVSGNLLAGRLLARHLVATVLVFPVLLAAAYGVLHFFATPSFLAMSLIVFLWGAIHTSGMVMTQTWMTSAAPEAHEFATSLYVSSANAGIALGAWIGGVFIDVYGIRGILACGLIFAALALIVIALKAMFYGAGFERLASVRRALA
ncbi:MFS transporter [Pseudomonas gingeri NCPPB 3146 = LMG 5327]|uniref:MFS transporter n=3 Tax=Pseudomonas TaxID=286 RepID=A0A7Y8CBY7_9PSED|nr:MFS transporter [Pseudomonas gingeri]NWE47691.1 MFS transporter [Pseudomonas gingeri]NWE69697.1 MFS transporter [Pseudomonas gingeri]PNQ88604.1 MFS transporter [Pseudomonas gingeri NCPPB 3146 = LMG 5327]